MPFVPVIASLLRKTHHGVFASRCGLSIHPRIDKEAWGNNRCKNEFISSVSHGWLWASRHQTRTVKLKRLNGIPPLIILFIYCNLWFTPLLVGRSGFVYGLNPEINRLSLLVLYQCHPHVCPVSGEQSGCSSRLASNESRPKLNPNTGKLRLVEWEHRLTAETAHNLDWRLLQSTQEDYCCDQYWWGAQ